MGRKYQRAYQRCQPPAFGKQGRAHCRHRHGSHKQRCNQHGIAVLGQHTEGAEQAYPDKIDGLRALDLTQHRPPKPHGHGDHHHGMGLVTQRVPAKRRHQQQAASDPPCAFLIEQLAPGQPGQAVSQANQQMLEYRQRQHRWAQHLANRPLHPGVERWLRAIAQRQTLCPQNLLGLIPLHARRNGNARNDMSADQKQQAQPWLGIELLLPIRV